MPQTINTNLASLNAQRNLNMTQMGMATAMQRLSSGLRVNSSKDDAAGLAIAERMNAQIRGMNVAIRNANDGISLSQTAEGSLGKIGDSLQRMRELALQSRNASNSPSDKDSLDKEFGQLAQEIQRVIGSTNFNGKYILSTAGAGTQTFQVGPNVEAEDSIDIVTADLSTLLTVTTLTGGASPASRAAIGSAADADTLKTVIQDIDAALDLVNSERATLGSSQSRFESVIANLQISAENQSAARGRIMDADFAAETANLSRTQILQQAGTAMVAQANQLPQSVLQLLKG